MNKKIIVLMLIGLLVGCTPKGKELIEEVAPTCTEQGHKTYKEHGEETVEYIDALGHDFQFDHNEGACSTKKAVYVCSRCQEKKYESQAEEHVFGDEENYICGKKCTNCGTTQLLEPTNEWLNAFTAKYDPADLESIKALADLIDGYCKQATAANAAVLSETVCEKVEEMEDYIEKLDKAYFVAEMYYYSENSKEADKVYYEIDEAEEKAIAYYGNSLYKCFYSVLKDKVFEGEDMEEIEEFVRPYADTSIADLKSAITKLEDEIYDLKTDEEKYARFPELRDMRNQLAAKYGYDDYYHYATVKKYSRKYGEDNIHKYRSLIRQYAGRDLEAAETKFNAIYKANQSSFYSKYLALHQSTCGKNKTMLGILSDYFKTIKSEKYGVDMFDKVNTAFKEGRIVTSSYGQDAAYTQSDGLGGQYMYFKYGTYYNAAFTYVHEIGHYQFGSHDGIHDFDLFETHSQSNEALFLKYLKDIKYTNDTIMNGLVDYYFYQALSTITTYVVVDDFEEQLYDNYSDLGEQFKDGITGNEYAELLEALNRKYKTSISSNYTNHYYIKSSIYSISYSISLVPILALFADAETNLDAAKECYYKVLGFLNDDTYTGGDDYLSVLNYAGYNSPFEESTYQKIHEYVNNMK